MTTYSKEQQSLVSEAEKIVKIFKASEGEIRPHFILTGSSGSGKTFIIKSLSERQKVNFVEINAAQLTKEGTSGNSLSKALAPLSNAQGKLTIVFVDEFDKLFISGNSNTSMAHESTNGVQNEFLKVLESDETSVFGDYGKYTNVSVKNVLFVFAGAFNGEEDISLDRLRDFGIKTEFLGRVGLVYNAEKLSLESLNEILESSSLLSDYLHIFPSVSRDDVIETVKKYMHEFYEQNTLGVRLINTLISQYFIKGGKVGLSDVKKTCFTKTLELSE